MFVCLETLMSLVVGTVRGREALPASEKLRREPHGLCPVRAQIADLGLEPWGSAGEGHREASQRGCDFS